MTQELRHHRARRMETAQGAFPALAMLVLLLSPAIARGDGGQLRILETHGEHRIAVFTSPNPLRAGPIDVSVLVQHGATGAAVVEGRIVVALTELGAPRAVLLSHATSEAATNKLLRAAHFDLPRAGRWRVEVICQKGPEPITLEFDVAAATPLPRWLTAWPMFVWPVGAVALFAAHRALVARSVRRDRNHRSP